MPAPFAEATADTVAAFNRDHRRLRIAVARGPFETEAVSDLAISSLLLGDSPYDLLMMDVTWTAKYAAAGWLLPLDDWLDGDPLAGVVAGAREGNRLAGQLWRLPMLASMGLLYWRTDLMAAPPRTPAELVDRSKELQQQGLVRWGVRLAGPPVRGSQLRLPRSAAWFRRPVGRDGGQRHRPGLDPGHGGRLLAAPTGRNGCDAGLGWPISPNPKPAGLRQWRGRLHAQLALRLERAAETGQCGGRQGGHHHDGGRARPVAGRHPGQLGAVGAARQCPSRRSRSCAAGPHR